MAICSPKQCLILTQYHNPALNQLQNTKAAVWRVDLLMKPLYYLIDISSSSYSQRILRGS